MKPRVFLSHSKHDRAFIERVASDLRAARLDVWFDDWEIPTGVSLRRKIFQEGIPGCDVFFVYLTESSRQSLWVERELDAAFVTDFETQGGVIAIFVETDAIRAKLPLDLRSIRSPVFSLNDYARPLADLISRTWDVHGQRVVRQQRAETDARISRLEKARKEISDGFGHLVRMHNKPADFEWYEWHHRVASNGDGTIRVRAGIHGCHPPRLWWRYTFGISPESPGVEDSSILNFRAVDEETGQRLESVLFRDGLQDKDYVVVFPRAVEAGAIMPLEMSHVWPGVWQPLIRSGRDSSWFSVERPCPSVTFNVELPSGLEIDSFIVSPSPQAVTMTVNSGVLFWQCAHMAPGRYLWELSVR